MSEPEYFKTTHIGVQGGIYRVEHRALHAGAIHPGNRHQFDHLSVVHRGRLSVTIDGVEQTYEGSDSFEVKAEKQHFIKALADNTVFDCYFVLRDQDGQITSVFDGNVMRYS